MTGLPFLALITALLQTPGSVSASEVVVFTTRGAHALKLTQLVADTLRQQLPEHRVRIEFKTMPLPHSRQRTSSSVGKAIEVAGAQLGVVSAVTVRWESSVLTVVLVARDGQVLGQEVIMAPRRHFQKRVKRGVRALARLAETILAPPASTEALPEGVSGWTPEPGSEERDLASEDPSLQAAVRIGGGVAGFDERITSPGGEGDLRFGWAYSASLVVGAELMMWGSLGVSLTYRTCGGSVGKPHGVAFAFEPDRIGIKIWGIDLLLAYRIELGPVVGGVQLAFLANDQTADEQRWVDFEGKDREAVAVPSWRRFLGGAGLSVGFGDLSSEGATGQAGLLVLPLGYYRERPATSGSSASKTAVQFRVRGRYQFPALFGEWGGAFLELGGRFEHLWLGFKGVGTRRGLPRGPLVGTSGDAAGRRRDWGATLCVGYLL